MLPLLRPVSCPKSTRLRGPSRNKGRNTTLRFTRRRSPTMALALAINKSLPQHFFHILT